MGAWRSYQVSVTFRAPLEFAYRWCTDYTPEDGRYAGEDRSLGLRRRIFLRRSRRVVFENLFNVGKGWGWERHVVTLAPLDRWRSLGKGNFQESTLSYRLKRLPRDRTQFLLRWRSRPTGLSSGPRASKKAVEAYVTGLWRRRARSLERDYRRTIGSPARPRRSGSDGRLVRTSGSASTNAA
jgi:hypothetical protein